MKYKIRFLSSKAMGQYAGMNWWANRELGNLFPKMKKDEILLDWEYPAKTIRKNLVHEITEAKMMRERGMHYPQAHKIALKIEKKVK